MCSKPVSADCVFENHQHPNHRAAASNAVRAAAMTACYRARQSWVRQPPLFALERAAIEKRGPQPRPQPPVRGGGGCCCWSFRAAWHGHGAGSTGRTARRQRRQFDGWRGGWFRRQIDADGLFFGLDLAGFFFHRRHGAGGRARNVRRNISHKYLVFKINGGRRLSNVILEINTGNSGIRQHGCRLDYAIKSFPQSIHAGRRRAIVRQNRSNKRRAGNSGPA